MEVIPFQIDEKPQILCGWAECSRGHRWKNELGLVECPGCKVQVVAIRLVNCPTCNEPPGRRVVRVDHVAAGGWVSAQCKGQKGPGESIVVEMDRLGESYESGEQKESD